MSARVWLAELTAYDPGLPGTRTLRVATRAHVTGPAETPANTLYDGRLAGPLDVRRQLVTPGATQGRATIGLGELVVANDDGALDGWLDYAFDGHPLTLRAGSAGAAYPAGFPIVWTGTIEALVVERRAVRVRVRDATLALEAPLATARYAGDNVAPDGLEGDAALADVVKPLVLGRVKRVPLPLVNAAKLIYQLSDDTIQSLDEVYDAGVRLGSYAPFDWASTQTTYGGRALATDGTTLVMGGSSGGNPALYTTTDGVTFSVIGSLPFAATGEVVGLAFAPGLGTQGRFVAVTNRAAGGEIAYSDDAGATWTLATNPTTAVYSRVRFDARRGYFIAVGSGGAIHVDADGTGTWTDRSVGGVTDTLNDVAVGGPVVLAVGDAGRVCRSTSETLASFTAGTYGTVALRAALFADGTYYVGEAASGTALRSDDANEFVRVPLHNGQESFTVRDFCTADGWVVALLQLGNSNFVVAATRDHGRTWTASGITPRPAAVVALAVCPFEDRFYVAAGSTPATYASGAPATYASLADLEDDTLAPAPGLYKWISNAAGSYVRLGAPPAGTVTADCTQGAADANRTAGQLFVKALETAGYTTGDWSASDITALDAADNSVLGLWVDDDRRIADVLDALAETVGAWWGVDASGVFRIAQFTAPSGSPAFTLDEHDILRDTLETVRATDGSRGIPSTRTTLRYAYADSVALDGRASDVDTAVLTAHPLARSTVEDTCFTQPADALAEAVRRQALRGAARTMYRATVRRDATTEAIALGAVGTLAHPRFGLAAGVLVRVIGIEPDAVAGTITLTLWR